MEPLKCRPPPHTRAHTQTSRPFTPFNRASLLLTFINSQIVTLIFCMDTHERETLHREGEGGRKKVMRRCYVTAVDGNWVFKPVISSLPGLEVSRKCKIQAWVCVCVCLHAAFAEKQPLRGFIRPGQLCANPSRV